MTSPAIVELDEASRTLNAVRAWEMFPIRGAGDSLAEHATVLASAFIAVAAALRAAQAEIEHVRDYLADGEDPDYGRRVLTALTAAVREHHDDWHGDIPFRFCNHRLCHIADGDL